MKPVSFTSYSYVPLIYGCLSFSFLMRLVYLQDTGSFYDGSSEDFTTFSRSIVTVLAMMLALFDVQVG